MPERNVGDLMYLLMLPVKADYDTIEGASLGEHRPAGVCFERETALALAKEHALTQLAWRKQFFNLDDDAISVTPLTTSDIDHDFDPDEDHDEIMGYVISMNRTEEPDKVTHCTYEAVGVPIRGAPGEDE